MSVVTILPGDQVTKDPADSGDSFPRHASHNRADVTHADIEARRDVGLWCALLRECSNGANGVSRDAGVPIASTGTCERAEFIVTFCGLTTCHPECDTALSAGTLNRADADTVENDKRFIIADTSRIISAGVAWLARWHEVVRRIVATVLVQMVGDELSDTCPVPRKPINRSATPVAGMWTVTDFLEQHALMFAQCASSCGERMLGIADAQIRVRHGAYSIGLVVN